jgi:hypothetical protein
MKLKFLLWLALFSLPLVLAQKMVDINTWRAAREQPMHDEAMIARKYPVHASPVSAD